MTVDKLSSTALSALIPLCALALGCSQQPPAKTYIQAQETYTKAEGGYAETYAPDELLEARKLLDQAAEAKNGSPEQEHLAYLADRQTRLATSSGTLEYYQIEKSRAQANYIQQMESDRATAKEQLESTQEQLSKVEEDLQKKDANVDELEARRAELEQRKAALEGQLNQSEQARVDAEKRAAAAIASLNELANVKEEANETVITLSGSVLFKTGQAELLSLAQNKLDKVAEALKQLDDEKQIVIEGHTDSRGNSDMNQQLSQKRAESVLSYLASQGVSESKMKAVGRGEEDPVAENESPEGRANNRRVELRISNGPGKQTGTSGGSMQSQGSARPQ